jgi:hypothetical protein
VDEGFWRAGGGGGCGARARARGDGARGGKNGHGGIFPCPPQSRRGASSYSHAHHATSTISLPVTLLSRSLSPLRSLLALAQGRGGAHLIPPLPITRSHRRLRHRPRGHCTPVPPADSTAARGSSALATGRGVPISFPSLPPTAQPPEDLLRLRPAAGGLSLSRPSCQQHSPPLEFLRLSPAEGYRSHSRPSCHQHRHIHRPRTRHCAPIQTTNPPSHGVRTSSVGSISYGNHSRSTGPSSFHSKKG